MIGLFQILTQISKNGRFFVAYRIKGYRIEVSEHKVSQSNLILWVAFIREQTGIHDPETLKKHILEVQTHCPVTFCDDEYTLQFSAKIDQIF